MLTVKFTAAEQGLVYNVLRDALDTANAQVQDAITFADEFDADAVDCSKQEVALLEALLAKLV